MRYKVTRYEGPWLNVLDLTEEVVPIKMQNFQWFPEKGRTQKRVVDSLEPWIWNIPKRFVCFNTA